MNYFCLGLRVRTHALNNSFDTTVRLHLATHNLLYGQIRGDTCLYRTIEASRNRFSRELFVAWKSLIKSLLFPKNKESGDCGVRLSHTLSFGVTIDQVESVFSRVADCVIVLPAI